MEIWFQDEARVGQKGSLSYVWAPVGSRPPMVRDNRHDTAYIFGAICPHRGVGAAVVMPTVNTDCMNLHLAEISTQVTPGAVAALICDGAGWHQNGGKLILPGNIVLVPLPPYSPKLNPMENVSDYLRANRLSACVWATYRDIRDACCEAWNWLAPTTQTASPRSAPGNGRRSMSRAVGITRARGPSDKSPCPVTCSGRPLSRTVASYARTERSGRHSRHCYSYTGYSPNEWVDVEIKPHTDVTGLFRNAPAIVRLVRPLQNEQNGKWAGQCARDTALETMAQLRNTALVCSTRHPTDHPAGPPLVITEPHS